MAPPSRAVEVWHIFRECDESGVRSSLVIKDNI
jgi:hypothetical protein